MCAREPKVCETALPPLTPPMIAAAVFEICERFPDVVLLGRDGERLAERIWQAMGEAAALPSSDS